MKSDPERLVLALKHVKMGMIPHSHIAVKLKIQISGIIPILERFESVPKLVGIQKRTLSFLCKQKTYLYKFQYGSLRERFHVNGALLVYVKLIH